MTDRGAVGEGDAHQQARIASPVDAVAWKAPAGSTISGMAGVEEKTARTWNTRNLGLRVGTDLIAAASAGVLVAPIITIIDRCVNFHVFNGNS
jgi:hypothetical protein